MFVKEIMTENPACCTADTGLDKVARLMLENDCGCIPVVDNENSKLPIGVITDRDITLRTVAEGKNPLDLAAGDAMTKSIISVTPETTLEDCCNLMEEKQLRRIAVVDSMGACCGIVSQADIAAKDKNIAGEVVQEVSRAAFA